jgi:RimJ/RimL family protein N-acetyltransferase
MGSTVSSEEDQSEAFPVGSALPSEILVRSAQLPRKPDPVILTGARVRLAPLDLERDAAALFQISNGSAVTVGDRRCEAYDPAILVWRYMSGGPFANAPALAEYLRAQVEAVDGLCLTVFDLPTGHPLGVANYMNTTPVHLKVELGSIWYGPVAQRSLVNTEATYLMLAHAFALGYRRVEWKCDALNARSRRAALRIGFQFEGIQEQHFIIKGRNRDTAWFRMLDHEWPHAGARLREMLAL